MSIVALKKATLYAPDADQKELLGSLQELGMLHLIPLRRGDETGGGGVAPDSKKALKFLLQAPIRRKQLHEDEAFQAEHVKSQALHLKARLKELEEEREILKKRIAALRPWGDFRLPPKGALGELNLWFYRIPHTRMRELEELDLIWEKAGSDHRFAYVVVISSAEPKLEFDRTHAGTQPLSNYLRQLEVAENEIEDVKAQRVRLTRWIDLYANALHHLEDQEALKTASQITYAEEGLCVIQGWFPASEEERLRRFCEQNRCALTVEEPADDEFPPTLLKNEGALASGEGLLSFYAVPGYRQYDPSRLFFLSFVIFFGIILGDAGYGVLIGTTVLLSWKSLEKNEKKRRMRTLLAALSFSTIAWGVLTGNYFGWSPQEGSILGALQLLRLDDYDAMMKLSILIGALHLVAANMMVGLNLYGRGEYRAMLAPAGWATAIVSGVAIYLWPPLSAAGQWGMAAGGVLILAFSGVGERGARRVGLGILGLTRITNAFGDVLSYLRLFALGLATSSMAIAFNSLAGQVASHYAGVGILLAVIVLLLGHTLNLALGILSGVVHGLRLNVIEYLNWGMPREGTPFRPFHKKEQHKWQK